VTTQDAALARNDRYLRDFVEALRMCPFARQCRESGKLHRRVVLDARDAQAAISAVEALPESEVEIALLIFPLAPARGAESARAFEAFCADLRDWMIAAHQGNPPFYCVAFHPDLPRDLLDAHRAVQFIRRSPDPTLQLVRASVLQAVRAGREGGSIYLGSITLEEALASASPLSLSDQIAENNFRTLQREGPEKIEALLDRMRPGLRTARLSLRELRREDLPSLVSMFGDPRWPFNLSPAEVAGFLERALASNAATGLGAWAMELQGELIGAAGVRITERPREIELLYHLRPEHWGRGYASEAARACLELARSRGFTRAVAPILPGNGASRRVAQRLGMSLESQTIRHGQLHDLWTMNL